MKIAKARSAISQSMDLFIIIAAVLGVGGVVTAAVYGLAGSAASNSSIQVVQASAQGSATAGVINSFSITVKNTGSTTISTGTVTVTLGGSKQPASPISAPNPTCSSGVGTMAGAAASPVLLNCTGVTLVPGAQVAISIGPISGLSTGWTAGTTYQVTVLLGSAQTSINVVA